MSEPRVAVVGAGLGGLAAAMRLQAAGCATTLYEARDEPGGRAYVFRDAGFTFDAGPTVITAPSCLAELFEATGQRLEDAIELIPNTPFYRIQWEDGVCFDYFGDAERLAAEIDRLAPGERAGYERFLRYSQRVHAVGYHGLVATPFHRPSRMLATLPELVRLRADRSVYSAVARFVRDERLRQVLSFHSLLIGGHPFETSAIYTLIHALEREEGVFFVRGGTGSLVRAMRDRFEKIGGTVRLSTPVERIRVGGAEGGRAGSGPSRAGRPHGPIHRVSTATDTAEFDAVVSNADVHHTYARLYAEEPAARRRTRRLERMDWSMSLFLIYFGTNRRYPGLAHHTVLLAPRYRALLDEIFHGSVLPDDLSLYLHAPTTTDPSLAPPDHECFYVLAPVPHLGHAPIDWDTVGPAFADRILAHLERFLPDLRRHVVTRRLFTPRDFERELAAHHGAAFSVAPTLTQSAWFRPHNKDTAIPGLYLVGAGTHPGAGVPGVINSAKATARLVLEDLGRG